MKKPPCALYKPDCPRRTLGCHDTCKEFKDWREYVDDTRHNQKVAAVVCRSRATQNKAKKDRKRYGAKYMKNKF